MGLWTHGVTLQRCHQHVQKGYDFCESLEEINNTITTSNFQLGHPQKSIKTKEKKKKFTPVDISNAHNWMIEKGLVPRS